MCSLDVRSTIECVFNVIFEFLTLNILSKTHPTVKRTSKLHIPNASDPFLNLVDITIAEYRKNGQTHSEMPLFRSFTTAKTFHLLSLPNWFQMAREAKSGSFEQVEKYLLKLAGQARASVCMGLFGHGNKTWVMSRGPKER
jgi:hypothetical protein